MGLSRGLNGIFSGSNCGASRETLNSLALRRFVVSREVSVCRVRDRFGLGAYRTRTLRAARAIAALPGCCAIGVIDSIEEVCTGMGGCLDNQQLIEPHARGSAR